MISLKQTININTLVIAEEMKYDGVTVLEYRIEYPELESGKYRKNIKTINTFYKKTPLLQNNFRTKLYQMAVDQYLHDIENGFQSAHLMPSDLYCYL